MAEELGSVEFNKWLNKRLETFEVDEVLASYISSIVITDDPETEKREMLTDIFQELGHVSDVEVVCSEILTKWSESSAKNDSVKETGMSSVNLGERVSSIVEQSIKSVIKQPIRSAEEQKLRDSILSRANYVSDEEEEGGESDEGGSTAPLTLPPAAGNAESVAREEREKREKLKAESDKKKATDKAGREKQKQKQEERKEKEKKRTQKQERRR